MLLASIWPEESFQASAELIWANAMAARSWLSRAMPSRGSWSKARARLPVDLWHRLFQAVAKKADRFSTRWSSWRGHRVILADGTCVSMPAQAELFAAFGRSTGRGGTRHYPLARVVAISLANTMVVLHYALGRYDDSETALLRTMFSDLFNRGTLTLFICLPSLLLCCPAFSLMDKSGERSPISPYFPEKSIEYQEKP